MHIENHITYVLRDIVNDDHTWLVSLHNDPLVLENITNPTAITIDDHMSWWARISQDKREQRKIFCVDGERAGLTKFYSIDKVNSNCALGADLHVSHRGKGHAKHMWNLMLDHAFMTLNVQRVSLTTAEFNDVARHVYKKLGFVKEGRLTQSLKRDNRFYDQECFYMLRHWRT